MQLNDFLCSNCELKIQLCAFAAICDEHYSSALYDEIFLMSEPLRRQLASMNEVDYFK